MKTFVRSLSLISFAVSTVALSPGCSSTASATSKTVAFVRGDLQETVDGSPQHVADAAAAAAKELQLAIESQSADGLGGNVALHSSDGTKISVTIKAPGDTRSRVGIRVGTFGDKELQQRIFDKIKTNLPAALPLSVDVTLQNKAPAAPPSHSVPSPTPGENPLAPAASQPLVPLVPLDAPPLPSTAP